jgi:hypothetical protein
MPAAVQPGNGHLAKFVAHRMQKAGAQQHGTGRVLVMRQHWYRAPGVLDHQLEVPGPLQRFWAPFIVYETVTIKSVVSNPQFGSLDLNTAWISCFVWVTSLIESLLQAPDIIQVPCAVRASLACYILSYLIPVQGGHLIICGCKPFSTPAHRCCLRRSNTACISPPGTGTSPARASS